MPLARGRHRRTGRAFQRALASAALLLAGCSQILGIEPLSERPADGGPVDAPVDARRIDAGPIDAGIDTTCSEGAIENATGATPIDTAPAGNDLGATCGGETSPDQILVWTAPVTDYYVFDTFGSGFDTVLALFDECGGAELACSNNVGNQGQSEVVHKFRQGEQALVLVDGSAGDSGQGTLNIAPVTCPEADLEGQTFPLELTTLGSSDDFSSQCGGVDQEDRAFHWVAPADGLYYFHVTSGSFRPTIALLDGPRCTDRVLGCSPSFDGPRGAEVVRFLRAGEPVTVVVDGMEGAGLFNLDIGIKEGGTCPAGELVPFLGVVESFTPRTLAPSCDTTRHVSSFGAELDTLDRAYVLTVPGTSEGCSRHCSVTAETEDEAIVLYLLEGGDCGGAELQCVKAFNDGASTTARATLDFPFITETTVFTVVAADVFPFSGNDELQISVECFEACS
jgi:hypothetical protein